VKREKGIEGTKNPVVVPSGQFKLSNFEVGSQNKKTVSSNKEQCTNEVIKEGKNKEQGITKKTAMQVIKESRARILAISKSLGYVRAKQQEEKGNQQATELQQQGKQVIQQQPEVTQQGKKDIQQQPQVKQQEKKGKQQGTEVKQKEKEVQQQGKQVIQQQPELK